MQRPRRGSTRRTPQALSWLKHNRPRSQNRSEEKSWDSWPKQEKWSSRGCQAQTGSLKDKHCPQAEASMPSVPNLPRDHIATDQAQWHSEKTCQYQKITKLLIHKIPLQRPVKDIGQSMRMDIRLQGTVMGILQESAKAYLIRLFMDTNLCVIHT